MEMKTKSRRYYETVLSETVTVTQSAEMIVPDLYPDIASIIDVTGMAFIKEKTVHQEHLETDGAVRVALLYTPDGENGLRKLDINIPFKHSMEGKVSANAFALCYAEVISAEARTINPRKVQATVTVMIEAKVFVTRELNLTDDICGDCEVLRTAHNVTMLTAAKEKAVTVSEDFELPASRPHIEEILKSEIKLSPGDIRVIGNKIVMKGMANLKIYYTNGGGIFSFEQETAISQILEADGLSDDSRVDIYMCAAGLELEPHSLQGAEVRTVGLTLYLDITALAYTEERLETVSDMYGIGKSLVPQFSTVSVKIPESHMSRRQSIRETVEIGDTVAETISVSATVGNVTVYDGHAGCDCGVTVVYITEDGEISSATRQIRVLCPEEAEMPNEIKAVLSGDITAMPVNDGVDVRFSVDFNMVNINTVNIKTVSGVTEDECKQDNKNQPNIVLRRTKHGETLWDIAKRYGVARRELAICNNLESIETVPEGKMLLIPR